MKRGKRETVYLLLDKNDITVTVDKKTTSQLLKYLKITRSQLMNILLCNSIVKNKFVIVEDI